MGQISWKYEDWPSGEPYDWGSAGRGHQLYDSIDYHVDLGCGRLKKGRIGVDIFAGPGVNVIMDLDKLEVLGLPLQIGGDAIERLRHVEPPVLHSGLPFADNEIESIVSHHALEHIGDGFVALVDEVYRVLKPGGIFYPITPLFPSMSALADPTHKRMICEETWTYFCGHLGDEANPTGCWMDSFAVPYTKARFEKLHQDITPRLPVEKWFTTEDAREIRVALRAVK